MSPARRRCPTSSARPARGRWSTIAAPSSGRCCGRVTDAASSGRFRTRARRLHPDRLGHRRSGGGRRQPPVAGRPGPGRQHRRLRRPVRQDRHDLRRRRHAGSTSSGAGPPTRTSCAHALEAMVAAGRPPAAVLLTHNETSTGVTNPLEALAAVARAAVPGRPHPGRRHQRPRRPPLRDRRAGASTSS